MRLPRWYLFEWVMWLFTGLPLLWFATGFTGVSIFSLPDPPPLPWDWPFGFIVWLFGVALIYHPLLMLPVALWRNDSDTGYQNGPNVED
jgi:hypothetical protein